MASLLPTPDPVEDTLCPICTNPMRKPVSVDCGHNFCKNCIDQYFVKRGEVGDVLCPVYRIKIKKKSIRPYWQLESFVEKAILQSQSTGKGNLCATHKEKRLLFCEEDKELMCLVCEKSVKHKNHSVLPVEEAAPLFKEEIMTCLKTLREKKEEVLSYKADTEKESQDLLEQVKAEREKMVTTFKELHQYLEEQEKNLLAQMKEVMEETERGKKNHLDKLDKELLFLEITIQEMEERLHQPAVDLLQDIESFLGMCKLGINCKNSSIEFPAALMWNIRDFSDINPFLEGVIKQFQDSLLSGLQLQKANIHFDPETAQPTLIVHEDGKPVRWIFLMKFRRLYDSREQFNKRYFVLECEEFTAGRHFWEVIVDPEHSWSMGVAKKSVQRKGEIEHLPAGEKWHMGKSADGYWSYCNGSDTSLSLSNKPKRIRVVLNCEGGRVAFYDAERRTLIWEHLGAPFAKETLCPFFSLGEGCRLSLAPLS